jgi:hypothetical protein
MKKLFSILCLIALCNLYTPLVASAVQVPADTEITLISQQGVTSKNPDNTIPMHIKEDVIINGVTVFKADGRATLNLVDSEKAGFFGNPGEMTISNGYAYDTKGNKHKIIVTKKFEGRDKTWVKVTTAAGLLLWPLLLFGFVKGNEAKLTPAIEIYATTSSAFNY